MELSEGQQVKKLNSLLEAARNEGAKITAVKISSHLDGLICHVVRNELSAVEIVELLQVESRKLHNAGLGIGGASC
ncbi:MAG TPA: DUF2732 family protein [Buttiauxella sp.]|jgi:hypothetical protein